jgi:outer membrane protein assembly factor BamB
VLVVSGHSGAPSSHVELNGSPAIFGLNASTGATLWSFSGYETTEHGRPYNIMPIIVADDTPSPSVLYETMDGAVFKHALLTGEILWSHPSPATDSSTTGGCAMAHGDGKRVLICVSNDGNHDTIDFHGLHRAFDVADGSLLWQTRTERGGQAAPAIADGRVFIGLMGGGAQKTELAPIGVGMMSALNLTTGELLWQTPTDANPSGEAVSCAPDTFNNAAVGADGTVYFGFYGGFVYAVDGVSGELLDSYEIKEGIQGAPAIGDGVVYFQGCTTLFAFR